MTLNKAGLNYKCRLPATENFAAAPAPVDCDKAKARVVGAMPADGLAKVLFAASDNGY
jgi:hypothetical protein